MNAWLNQTDIMSRVKRISPDLVALDGLSAVPLDLVEGKDKIESIKQSILFTMPALEIIPGCASKIVTGDGVLFESDSGLAIDKEERRALNNFLENNFEVISEQKKPLSDELAMLFFVMLSLSALKVYEKKLNRRNFLKWAGATAVGAISYPMVSALTKVFGFDAVTKSKNEKFISITEDMISFFRPRLFSKEKIREFRTALCLEKLKFSLEREKQNSGVAIFGNAHVLDSRFKNDGKGRMFVIENIFLEIAFTVKSFIEKYPTLKDSEAGILDNIFKKFYMIQIIKVDVFGYEKTDGKEIMENVDQIVKFDDEFDCEPIKKIADRIIKESTKTP